MDIMILHRNDPASFHSLNYANEPFHGLLLCSFIPERFNEVPFI